MTTIGMPDNNMGGALELYLAPTDDCNLVIAQGSLTFSFKPGKNWVKFELVDDQSGATQPIEPDFDGDLVDVNISVLVAKAQGVTDAILKSLQPQSLYAVLLDANLGYYFFGRPESPLRLAINRGTGASAPSVSGYSLTLTNQQSDFAINVLPASVGIV